MYALMEWDVNNKKPKDEFTPEQMQSAKKLIDEEITKREELDANMWQVISNCLSECIRYQGRFKRLSSLNVKEQIEVLNEQFKVNLFFLIKSYFFLLRDFF